MGLVLRYGVGLNQAKKGKPAAGRPITNYYRASTQEQENEVGMKGSVHTVNIMIHVV